MKTLTVLRKFFSVSDTVKITRTPKPGASGPKVIIFTVNGSANELALKYGASRVPINQQITNREKLAPFFDHRLVPILNYSVIGAEEGWAILMPAYEGNFHDAIAGNGQSFYHGETSPLWKSIIQDFVGLWAKSKRAWDASYENRLARLPQPRAEKIATAIKTYSLSGVNQSLLNSWHLPLTINGKNYPSLAETFAQILTAYRPPTVVVSCHGDPNANNILIDKRSNWAMADWEWCGLHDWRLSASHLVGWWLSSSAIQEQQPKARIDKSRLALEYGFRLKPNVQSIISSATSAFGDFASSVSDTQFRKQWKLMLAVLLFGEVRFLKIRKMPQETAIYLLGEAIKTWWD